MDERRRGRIDVVDIINKWSPILRRKVDPTAFFEEISGLSKYDVQQVSRVLDREGPMRGMDKLLDCIGRREKKCFFSFLVLLETFKYHETAEDIIHDSGISNHPEFAVMRSNARMNRPEDNFTFVQNAYQHEDMGIRPPIYVQNQQLQNTSMSNPLASSRYPRSNEAVIYDGASNQPASSQPEADQPDNNLAREEGPPIGHQAPPREPAVLTQGMENPVVPVDNSRPTSSVLMSPPAQPREWNPNGRIEEISDKIFCELASVLNTRCGDEPGWRRLGHEVNMSRKKIKEIEKADDPAEAMLDKLNEQLGTMQEFVDLLQQIQCEEALNVLQVPVMNIPVSNDVNEDNINVDGVGRKASHNANKDIPHDQSNKEKSEKDSLQSFADGEDPDKKIENMCMSTPVDPLAREPSEHECKAVPEMSLTDSEGDLKSDESSYMSTKDNKNTLKDEMSSSSNLTGSSQLDVTGLSSSDQSQHQGETTIDPVEPESDRENKFSEKNAAMEADRLQQDVISSLESGNVDVQEGQVDSNSPPGQRSPHAASRDMVPSEEAQGDGNFSRSEKPPNLDMEQLQQEILTQPNLSSFRDLQHSVPSHGCEAVSTVSAGERGDISDQQETQAITGTETVPNLPRSDRNSPHTAGRDSVLVDEAQGDANCSHSEKPPNLDREQLQQEILTQPNLSSFRDLQHSVPSHGCEAVSTVSAGERGDISDQQETQAITGTDTVPNSPHSDQNSPHTAGRDSVLVDEAQGDANCSHSEKPPNLDREQLQQEILTQPNLSSFRDLQHSVPSHGCEAVSTVSAGECGDISDQQETRAITGTDTVPNLPRSDRNSPHTAGRDSVLVDEAQGDANCSHSEKPPNLDREQLRREILTQPNLSSFRDLQHSVPSHGCEAVSTVSAGERGDISDQQETQAMTGTDTVPNLPRSDRNSPHTAGRDSVLVDEAQGDANCSHSEKPPNLDREQLRREILTQPNFSSFRDLQHSVPSHGCEAVSTTSGSRRAERQTTVSIQQDRQGNTGRDSVPDLQPGAASSTQAETNIMSDVVAAAQVNPVESGESEVLEHHNPQVIMAGDDSATVSQGNLNSNNPSAALSNMDASAVKGESKDSNTTKASTVLLVTGGQENKTQQNMDTGQKEVRSSSSDTSAGCSPLGGVNQNLPSTAEEHQLVPNMGSYRDVQNSIPEYGSRDGNDSSLPRNAESLVIDEEETPLKEIHQAYD